ncbi:hypothetical protein CYMTET_41982 [Cymbomonas tetramitiformis]|uniref:Uncharacterized protein n=1 Tax=Cymbomonas tetramitiformis TaxID=36881 RepID=A0AAE0C6B9_9CHLO|nr:hypothetical protein CYMTET_41982 [Cymbomonas tetramitiformis]
MAGVTTGGARRALMKDSDVDNDMGLKYGVLNSPTPATPAVAEPAAAARADDTADVKIILGGKADSKDDTKLVESMVYLKTQFENAGLDVASFDFDDTTKQEVLKSANTLVYETLFEIIGTVRLGCGRLLIHLHRFCI